MSRTTADERPAGEVGPKPIRFGIPTLDILLGRLNPQVYNIDSVQEDRSSRPFGIYENSSAGPGGESLCLCIIGTDGTGKSVLGMHLAAQYLADRPETSCRVIYASTDLSYARAKTTWDNFALGFPRTRITDPFDFNEVKEREERKKAQRGGSPARPDPELGIVPMSPFGAEPIVEISPPKARPEVAGGGPTRNVFFLDIASRTSGDDWSYLNRLVASLRPRDPEEPSDHTHLLVVDTVDDLELLVGERDAFGNTRDRRSRIAELIRTAAGKCHILLVASDSETSRAPEEYIADVVIRVRFQRQGEYIRRVLAVEKVRGQNHIRGEHDLTIRSGIGASTGWQEHFDDPRIVRPDSDATDGRTDAARIAGDFETFQDGTGRGAGHFFQSYAYIVHSLHYINNSIMRADGPNAHGDGSGARYADFGMRYLDEMLARPAGNRGRSGGPSEGIPTHEPAALIGEDGTFKSALGKAFLSRVFLPESVGTAPKGGGGPHGAAILITTKTLDRATLLNRINEHLPAPAPLEAGTKIICRRLEFHHMTPSTLFHIVKQAVRAAQRMIFHDAAIMGELASTAEYRDFRGPGIDRDFRNALRRGRVSGLIPRSEVIRRMVGWRIRLVIDNWTTLEEMYPEVKADPLFLLCMLFFLRREGIATLIIANEDRGFSDGFNLQQNRRLRDQTAVHLFTWRTPFFGESRVAITVNPPMGRRGRFDSIRELRRLYTADHVLPRDDRALAVSPYFELFVGLEKGDPKYVPLRICLIEDPSASVSYLADIQNLFGWLIDADPSAKIISIEKIETYERLRDFSQIQGSSRFPYTLVSQVDEFWAKTGPLHFQRINRYLESSTARTEAAGGRPLRCVNYLVEDPLNVFQPSATQIGQFEKAEKPAREWSRLDFFTPPGYSLGDHLKADPDRIMKVPYTWDFGFLMCHRDAWEEAVFYEKKNIPDPEKRRINLVWSRMNKARPPETEPRPLVEAPKRTGEIPTWREFVEACEAVAKFASTSISADRPHGFSTFGIAPEIQESLSCLLLEIWASEVDLGAATRKSSPFTANRHEAESKEDLRGITRRPAYRASLLRALYLLYDLIPPSLLGSDHRLRSGEDPEAVPVAARVWYSSASSYQNRPTGKDWFVPASLPGRFSTRGDWFLGIVRGSRSPRLGERAIDLLSTRRGNIVRLQLGIGLPVRDNLDDAIELWTSLRHIDEWGNPVGRISYKDLVRLGGSMKTGTGPEPGLEDGPLRWLWRSRVLHYDRHARILRRWTCAMLLKLRGRLSGRSGVSAYDESGPRTGRGSAVPDWFDVEMDEFGKTLARATID